MKTKVAFCDLDGFLCALEMGYFKFLTQHPKWSKVFGKFPYYELDQVLPIDPKRGTLELKDHPEFGIELDKDFCQDHDFFNYRPLYEGAIEMLKALNALGIKLFTMSATFDVEVKQRMLEEKLEAVKDIIGLHCISKTQLAADGGKVEAMKKVLLSEGYDLSETQIYLIDDSILNLKGIREQGITPIRFRNQFTTQGCDDVAEVFSFEELVDFFKADSLIEDVMPSIGEAIPYTYKEMRLMPKWSGMKETLDEVIENIFEGKTSVAVPNIVMMAGVPATGKSTYVDNNTSENDVVIGFDRVMAKIPFYAKDSETIGLKETFAKWELPARIMGYRVLEKAILGNFDIIFDHSNHINSHVELANFLLKTGVDLKMVCMKCSLETSLARAIEREARINRHTPPAIIKERYEIFDGVMNNFQKLGVNVEFIFSE